MRVRILVSRLLIWQLASWWLSYLSCQTCQVDSHLYLILCLSLSQSVPLIIYIHTHTCVCIYSFFCLSCKSVLNVKPEGAQITASYQHTCMTVKDTHTHTQRNTGVHSNKPAPHASHIHRRCDGSPVCQVIWQHLWAPMWPESFQTAGQEAWTAAPHALSSSHPSLLPPHTQTFPSLTSILTHCFSPCRTATLRRARQDKRWWTGHLWCELSHSPANVMDRQLALTWANSRRKQSWSGNPQKYFFWVMFCLCRVSAMSLLCGFACQSMNGESGRTSGLYRWSSSLCLLSSSDVLVCFLFWSQMLNTSQHTKTS